MISTSSENPIVKDLLLKLCDAIDELEFIRLFLLLVLSLLLCPNSTDKVSPSHFHALFDINAIPSLDWSDSVLASLMEGVTKFKKLRKQDCAPNHSVNGCIFLLAFIYLDFLGSGCVKFLAGFPRIRLWNDSILRKLENIDLISHRKKEFGRLCVKDINQTVSRVGFSVPHFSNTNN